MVHRIGGAYGRGIVLNQVHERVVGMLQPVSSAAVQDQSVLEVDRVRPRQCGLRDHLLNSCDICGGQPIVAVEDAPSYHSLFNDMDSELSLTRTILERLIEKVDHIRAVGGVPSLGRRIYPAIECVSV